MTPLTLTSADGTPLRGGRWDPPGEVRADILFCHGLAEHLGRYEDFGAFFTKHGFRVTGVELRGHGESGGKRGHVRQWSEFVDDLSAAAQTIPTTPLMFAHSMGGLVALDYLRNHPVKAFATTGTLLGIPADAPAWKMAAARVLSRVLPGLPLANEIDSKWICTDAAVVAAYDADPLVFRSITPRFFTEMCKAIDRVQANAARYEAPALFQWGADDRVVNVAAIAPFVERYGGDRESKAWEGLYHEIHREPCKEQVLTEILTFFGRHA